MSRNLTRMKVALNGKSRAQKNQEKPISQAENIIQKAILDTSLQCQEKNQIQCNEIVHDTSDAKQKDQSSDEEKSPNKQIKKISKSINKQKQDKVQK